MMPFSVEAVATHNRYRGLRFWSSSGTGRADHMLGSLSGNSPRLIGSRMPRGHSANGCRARNGATIKLTVSLMKAKP
jgi:hypothetical protein